MKNIRCTCGTPIGCKHIARALFLLSDKDYNNDEILVDREIFNYKNIIKKEKRDDTLNVLKSFSKKDLLHFIKFLSKEDIDISTLLEKYNKKTVNELGLEKYLKKLQNIFNNYEKKDFDEFDYDYYEEYSLNRYSYDYDDYDPEYYYYSDFEEELIKYVNSNIPILVNIKEYDLILNIFIHMFSNLILEYSDVEYYFEDIQKEFNKYVLDTLEKVSESSKKDFFKFYMNICYDSNFGIFGSKSEYIDIFNDKESLETIKNKQLESYVEFRNNEKICEGNKLAKVINLDYYKSDFNSKEFFETLYKLNESKEVIEKYRVEMWDIIETRVFFVEKNIELNNYKDALIIMEKLFIDFDINENTRNKDYYFNTLKELYKKDGKKEKVIDTIEKQIKSNSHLENILYLEYKENFDEKEWETNEKQKFYDKFSKAFNLNKVYYNENDLDKLFESVKNENSIYTYSTYAETLANIYPTEYIDFYIKHVEERLECNLSGKSDYKSCIYSLRDIVNIDGAKGCIEALFERLIINHSRRRAMKETIKEFRVDYL